MKLTTEEITLRLQNLPGWHEKEGKLTKQFRFQTYMEGVDFVNRVADLSEEVQHHPDVLLTYRQVELQLTTHDQGGITEKDFAWIQHLETE
ncbi:4a-hydroxytetrahydrobiopterin dehydratase [Marininema mesophilum]|uniref:4a-hydroxytetrahydrobiopterin dehydratase n=1 Tax=Marininema mesophilum TaxID=1048340 RepID=A0A1H2QRC9_9BACL|nr:4a-hydroxytetrahydrobiopterin dehydratase [Marininema mesophilum]SDW09722.1 4a-hydroxytetrahydrobiopterin dehydratase [Marininema mesophilum]